ncbi:MAG: hypothetical protein EBZ74_05850 [Planctomycetia bacterium]|nr:hypothetical protein [Planctomycetia bacterium]
MQLPESLCTSSHTPSVGRLSRSASDPSAVCFAHAAISSSSARSPASGNRLPDRSSARESRRRLA